MKRVTPNMVAKKTTASFAEYMETWTGYTFYPGAACKLCQNVMAAVKVRALAVGLTEKQAAAAIKIAKPLYIVWLKEYIKSGKGVIAPRQQKKV